MKRTTVLVLALACTVACYCQPIGSFYKTTPSFKKNPSQQLRLTTAEVCDNNLDDDTNGLKDNDDFTCYFSASNTASCLPTKIVWGCSNMGLHWANLETGAEHFVGNLGGKIMYDISWASNGKLYGIESILGGIWEIDPYTASIQLKGFMPGYYAGNGMTADGSGNLYVAAYQSSTQCRIIRINIASWQVTEIANVTAANLISGGDLSFLNGFLYLGCDQNKIAKINVGTGDIQSSTLTNAPVIMIMGLTTMGDGYLYLSALNKIYRLDPNTMVVDPLPAYSFAYGDIFLMGLSNYTETCNAPMCRARVNIAVTTPQPFCSKTGVRLKANGTGITGMGQYNWTKPSGEIVTGDTLTATVPGMYYVRYHTLPDTCGDIDSVFLNIIPYPNAGLGNDAILCAGSSMVLTPLINTGIITYSWSNGSSVSSLTISQPGMYWLEASNLCGSSKDTIVVMTGTAPLVQLPADVSICPGNTITLKNELQKQSWDQYLWSGNSTSDSILINAPGMYWLQSSHACGMDSDSIMIAFKDSCACFPLVASVNLGAGKELCPYDELVLTNSVHQNGFHYLWQDGSLDENFRVKTPGWYWVDVSTYCGIVRDSIHILPKSEGCYRNVFVPTAFTPNGDGKNDLFKPFVQGKLSGYAFLIYNRWGQVVFQTNNSSSGWNGRINGASQSTSVYTWTCWYQFAGQPVQLQKGTVILIK